MRRIKAETTLTNLYAQPPCMLMNCTVSYRLLNAPKTGIVPNDQLLKHDSSISFVFLKSMLVMIYRSGKVKRVETYIFDSSPAPFV